MILLPDVNGKVGAIQVTTKEDSRLLNQAYSSVATTRTGLSKTVVLNKTEVDRDYADLLAAEPTRPVAFTVYFDSNSVDLMDRSRAQLAQIIEQIKLRLPTEVNVIGHTDTTGTDAINDKLSLKRARQIEKMLTGSIPGLNTVTVRSFGSKDLLISTPPNVDEPRNRRVEILIL